jgi:hypothetical protein
VLQLFRSVPDPLFELVVRLLQLVLGLFLFLKVSIDHVESLLDHMAEHGNIRGIMLEIVVHDHHNLTARVMQAGDDRIVLADILAQIQPRDKIIFAGELANDLPARVRTGIVDEDELVGVEMTADLPLYSGGELRQAVGTPVHWNNDG